MWIFWLLFEKLGDFFQSSGHPGGGKTFLQRNFKFSSQVKKKARDHSIREPML
jgi:hypothetical protein